MKQAGNETARAIRSIASEVENRVRRFHEAAEKVAAFACELPASNIDLRHPNGTAGSFQFAVKTDEAEVTLELRLSLDLIPSTRPKAILYRTEGTETQHWPYADVDEALDRMRALLDGQVCARRGRK